MSKSSDDDQLLAQRDTLIAHLDAMGLTPQDVPAALENLRKEIEAELLYRRKEGLGKVV